MERKKMVRTTFRKKKNERWYHLKERKHSVESITVMLKNSWKKWEAECTDSTQSLSRHEYFLENEYFLETHGFTYNVKKKKVVISNKNIKNEN